MKNGLILTALMLSLLAFAGMMRIKTDVQTMDRERLRLVKERAQLRETKRVLEAEWALLASPERLQAIADQAGKVYFNGSALSQLPLVPEVVNATVSPSVVGQASPTQPSPTGIF
ncbi:MAG: hypothetical protein INF43_05775 [Alphaproteobacteria bacterium]|nr:hypothetical protein [Alphaproteobacteria bacterium]